MSANGIERYIQSVTMHGRRKMTPERFLYFKPGDLRKKSPAVKIHFLCYDPDEGHWLKEWVVSAPQGMRYTYREWHTLMKDKLIADFAIRFLSAMNARKGSAWRLSRVVAYELHDKPYRPTRKRNG
jgi:hypothetical protein